jgi:transposase
MDKTAVSTLCRIDWKTVGRICERVSADVLDPRRLDKLSKIGVDEVAWRKGYRFLTLVTDHETHKVVWGRPGKNQFAFDEFFAELGEDRTRTIKAVTLDMAPAFRRAVLNNAPQADICIDPFHVVQLVNRALEAERRALWRELQHEDAALANKFRGARWALLKNPEDLTSKQALTLEMIRESGNKLWEGYLLKESIRSVFAGDLSLEDADELLTTWSEKAMASSVRTFFVAGRTIKANREGILAGLRHGLNNGLIEGINNRVRLIVRRAFGFHSAEAVLALVMLSCGPVDLKLPHQMAR